MLARIDHVGVAVADLDAALAVYAERLAMPVVHRERVEEQGLAPVLAQRYAEALRRLRSQDKDITLLITESNPKLLSTFADVTLTIERGEIESRARM